MVQPSVTRVRRQKYPHAGPRRRRRLLFFLLSSYFSSGDEMLVVVAAAAAVAFPSPEAVVVVVPYGTDSLLIGFLPTRSVLVDQVTIDGTMGSVTMRQQLQRLMTLDGRGLLCQRRKYY